VHLHTISTPSTQNLHLAAAISLHPGSLAALAAFGRTTTLNEAAYCAPVSSISTGKR
jgi:hypothetical protein